MKIDITTLLAGGMETLPNVGKLTAADFGEALVEKLANLDDLLPMLNAEFMPAMAEMALPAAAATDDALGLKASIEENPAALLDDMQSENPQWQLQQLVMRTVAVADAPMRPAAVQGNTALTPTMPASGKKGASISSENLQPLNPLAEKTSSAPLSTPIQPLLIESAIVSDSGAPTLHNVTPQPVGLRPVALTSAAPAVTVSYPPETLEWKQSVSQHIATFSRNGMHNAEIRLHPEELGSLQITLRVHQEQAQIHIVSEHALVRQAMEQAMPQLRAALAETGLQLGQASVGADNPYAGTDAQGENASESHQPTGQQEELAPEEEIVPTLLTSTPGNIYGINTFA